MRWFGVFLLVLASAAFIASSVSFAFGPDPLALKTAAFLHLSSDPPAVTASAMARPDSRTLWLLLIFVWAVVIVHALRCVAIEWRRTRIASRRAAARLADNRPGEHAAFVTALLAAALWPWATHAGGAWLGLGLAAVMMVSALWAALTGQRIGLRVALRGTIGFFAGWACVAFYASFAAILIANLHLSPSLSAVVAVLLMMITAVEVQLRLGSSAAFSFAVIWALIGIAAGAMQTELTIATAAIVAIAAIVAVLVRVLS